MAPPDHDRRTDLCRIRSGLSRVAIHERNAGSGPAGHTSKARPTSPLLAFAAARRHRIMLMVPRLTPPSLGGPLVP